MIRVKDFINRLDSFGFSPFLMVPCSIFKPLNTWLINRQREVVFPPNEAHAMGFAVGSYCVTGKPAVVFLQNSGLNNIANAHTSLHYLYQIPVLLVVSWRGQPGRKDAPEHKLMGKITKKFLKALEIPAVILSSNSSKWKVELNSIASLINKEKKPAAVIIREGTFSPGKDLIDENSKYPLSRFEAIKIIKQNLKNKAVFISTNGFISRDSFAVLPSPDFYMMGSMGHAFSIGAGTAWGLSGKNSDLKVVILDGDGSCLMHLGSLALVGLEKIKKSNLIYLVLDNEAYESTGSQPSLSPEINFIKIAEGLGFPQVFSVKKASDLKKVIKNLKPRIAAFIHIKINRQKTETAARVSDKYTCEQITKRFRRNFR